MSTPSRSLDVPPRLKLMAGWTWRVAVLVAGAYAVLLVMAELRLVVVPLAVALLAATLLEPVAARLRGHGTPPAAAAVAVVGGALVAVAGVGSLVVPAVADQFDDMADRVEEGVAQVGRWAEDLGIGGDEGPDLGEAAVRSLRENSEAIGSGALGGAVVAVEVAIGLVLFLFFLFFLVKDGDRMWRALVAYMPAHWRPHAGELGDRAWTALRTYVQSQVVVAAVDAVFIALALWLIGVPLVLPLAVFTFFACFVPIAGAFTAGAVAALVALVTLGPEEMALVVIATILVHQIEGNLLQPLIMGRMLSLHPMLLLAAVTSGAILGGIVGAALAAPVAALGVVVAGYARETADG